MAVQSLLGLLIFCIRWEETCHPYPGTGPTGLILFVYGLGANRGEVAATFGTFIAATAGAGTQRGDSRVSLIG